MSPRVIVRWRNVAAAVAGILLASGCQILPEAQPDPTRYFLLSAPGGDEAESSPGSGRTVGLRAVELPGYLRNSRSQVVTRGNNEVSFREFDRWAEPLDVGLTRVMREALLATDEVARVAVSPFAGTEARDVDITIRVRECAGAERSDGSEVVAFSIAYELTEPGAAGALLKQGTFVAPATAWDGEPATLAALLGQAAADAARAIAAELP